MESNDLPEDEKTAEPDSNDQPEPEKVDEEKAENSDEEMKPDESVSEDKPEESPSPAPVDDAGADSTEPDEGSDDTPAPSEEPSGDETPTPEPESSEPALTDDEPEEEKSEEEPTIPEPAEPQREKVEKEPDAGDEDNPKFEKGIFAIKTSIGHEKMVADTLEGRVRRRKADVYSIMLPPNLRGYLLIEALDNREALRELIKGVQHARTLVEGTTSIEEIKEFLTPKPIVSGIEEGDIVEVIAGPFKGEKAKVKQIDVSKEEITIELFEAMVSIPVTIRGDHVRVLEKESS
jgi:transcriptional antiterminator NusG